MDAPAPEEGLGFLGGELSAAVARKFGGDPFVAKQTPQTRDEVFRSQRRRAWCRLGNVEPARQAVDGDEVVSTAQVRVVRRYFLKGHSGRVGLRLRDGR